MNGVAVFITIATGVVALVPFGVGAKDVRALGFTIAVPDSWHVEGRGGGRTVRGEDV